MNELWDFPFCRHFWSILMFNVDIASSKLIFTYLHRLSQLERHEKPAKDGNGNSHAAHLNYVGGY